jgi:hypothetical protein
MKRYIGGFVTPHSGSVETLENVLSEYNRLMNNGSPFVGLMCDECRILYGNVTNGDIKCNELVIKMLHSIVTYLEVSLVDIECAFNEKSLDVLVKSTRLKSTTSSQYIMDCSYLPKNLLYIVDSYVYPIDIFNNYVRTGVYLDAHFPSMYSFYTTPKTDNLN